VVQDKLIIGNDECGVGVELLTIIGTTTASRGRRRRREEGTGG
jgi:hypothetical protein